MNNPFGHSPDAAKWAKGFDEGKTLARGGERWQAGLDPTDPTDRGRVAGWRLQNGLTATPMQHVYDDSEWGSATEPVTSVQ